MALTFTETIPLGYNAPDFSLPDTVSGKLVSLNDLDVKNGLVVLFICNHCPYVKHLNEGLVKVANEYMPKGFAFVAISVNDIERYPDDSPEEMKKVAKELGYPFPYLYDESQQSAKEYHAVCTPDISVFDQNLKCVYRGQFDDSRPGSDIPVTGEDLKRVMDSLLENNPIAFETKPSSGCSIKWRE